MVHNVASPTHRQAQHRQLPIMDNFLTFTRQLQAGPRQWLNLACTQHLLEAPELTHPMTTFRTPSNQLHSPISWGQPLHSSSHTMVLANPHSQVPDNQSHPVTCQQQPRLNYNRRAYTTHTRDNLEHLAQVVKKTPPLNLTGHLLRKTTLPTLGDTADLCNTQKQTQEVSQNEETKKHNTNKRTEKELKDVHTHLSKDIQMANKHMKRYSILLVIRQPQIKTTMKLCIVDSIVANKVYPRHEYC